MLILMAIDAATFGRQLVRARERAGLTQGDVLDSLARLGFEMTQGAYSHYEKGRRFPDPPLLAAIAQVVETSVDHLLLLTESDAPVSELLEELAAATGSAKINKIMQRLSKDQQQQVITFAEYLNNMSGNDGAEAP